MNGDGIDRDTVLKEINEAQERLRAPDVEALVQRVRVLEKALDIAGKLTGCAALACPAERGEWNDCPTWADETCTRCDADPRTHGYWHDCWAQAVMERAKRELAEGGDGDG